MVKVATIGGGDKSILRVFFSRSRPVTWKKDVFLKAFIHLSLVVGINKVNGFKEIFGYNVFLLVAEKKDYSHSVFFLLLLPYSLYYKLRSEPQMFQRYYRTAATNRAVKNEERFIWPGKSFDRSSVTYVWGEESDPAPAYISSQDPQEYRHWFHSSRTSPIWE